jgi:2-methylcitrate dehydratase
MALVPDLAEFVSRADWQTLSNNARRRLKIRLVDSLGCAIGALEGGSISVVVRY